MQLLKKMKIRRSERGVTFSFLGNETPFDVGCRYRYVIDVKKKRLVILPADTGNTVSKKRAGERIKSLFDIRKKDALHAFRDAEFLQVSVYSDRILVEGFAEADGRIKGAEQTSEKQNVIRIARRVFTLEELRLASGCPGQISIEDFLIGSSGTREYTVPVTDLTQYRDLRIPLTLVSCFSGAGVLDYSFVKEGFKVVFAIERDADACATYRHNLGNHIRQADITAYPKQKVPGASVIIGGPPCRPLTKERMDRYSAGKSPLEHPDNHLFSEYLTWIRETGEYQVFVLENVPQILTEDDGAYLELIQERLPEYELTYAILNDADCGGFQLRERAIIVGSKIGKVELPAPSHSPEQYCTVAQALAAVDEGWPNFRDVTESRGSTLERMKHVPPGGNWRNIPEDLRTKAVHSNAYRRLDPDKPCITLVNYRKPCIIHPHEHRTLSVSEASALSGLDRNFRFFGTLGAMQQQLGNLVPTGIGRAVAAAVRNVINSANRRCLGGISLA